jgi:hypothetical protein
MTAVATRIVPTPLASSDEQIVYKKTHPVKYKLLGDFRLQTSLRPAQPIVEPANGKAFIELSTQGVLTIKKDYAWDGLSGPTIDTKASMRASLVHDALYQLIQKGRLPQSAKLIADRLLRDVGLADGMLPITAHANYIAVQIAGDWWERRQAYKYSQVHYAPMLVKR